MNISQLSKDGIGYLGQVQASYAGHRPNINVSAAKSVSHEYKNGHTVFLHFSQGNMAVSGWFNAEDIEEIALAMLTVVHNIKKLDS